LIVILYYKSILPILLFLFPLGSLRLNGIGIFERLCYLSTMTVLLFSFLVLIVSYFAGILGALSGLGGGIIVIPALVLLFHVDMHLAMGASLISVMATSSGAAYGFLKEKFTNLRVGILLETGAVVGALTGALLVSFFPRSLIAIILGIVLLVSAYYSLRHKETTELDKPSHPWAVALKLEGSYQSLKGPTSYHVQHVPLGIALITLAGILSGLLGIGAGALKVLAMDQAMKIPYKVSTATSNFIIGITAAVSAGVYFAKGYIDPIITFPVFIGVLFGSYTGAKILTRTTTKTLRVIFSFVIIAIAFELIYKGMKGNL